MKCPFCSNEIPDGSTQCNTCGCKVIYNGSLITSSDQSTNDFEINDFSVSTQKRKLSFSKSQLTVIIAVVAIAVISIIALAVSKNNSKNEYYYNYNNTKTYSSQYYEGNSEVKDWMKDQASGKNYDTNDGGEYYCMGKNDTCPNKTYNAYDLYCDSCDPDGDNVEG